MHRSIPHFRSGISRWLCATGCVLLLAGCAGSGSPDRQEGSTGASRMIVDAGSDARTVLRTVPSAAAMERFEVLRPDGSIVSYVAFTETPVGGLVFINQKLVGTVSRHDARAFYSCRGYATATRGHWGHDAPQWVATLLTRSQPATSVKLEFSGKSTVQSIRAVVSDPMMGQVKSLFDMGTNPLNIFKTLDKAHDDMLAREEYARTLEQLIAVTPGTPEAKLAAIVRPEDVSFTSGGLVMAYPRFSVEFYLSDGIVKTIQQPSFYQLSRQHAALFYAPDTQWALCTPDDWIRALPSDTPTDPSPHG
ncbi:MAG: hypothetical protein JSR19_06255 [Proteobacteria bacterium]|nr:hypothetical protein [Pseudomonadota bacterium]